MCRRLEETSVRLVRMLTNNAAFDPNVVAQMNMQVRNRTLLGNARRIAVGAYAGRLAPAALVREALRKKWWERPQQWPDAQGRAPLFFVEGCPEDQQHRVDGQLHRYLAAARTRATKAGMDVRAASADELHASLSQHRADTASTEPPQQRRRGVVGGGGGGAAAGDVAATVRGARNGKATPEQRKRKQNGNHRNGGARGRARAADTTADTAAIAAALEAARPPRAAPPTNNRLVKCEKCRSYHGPTDPCRRQEPMKCFRCDKVGHYARDCTNAPTARTDSSSAGGRK